MKLLYLSCHSVLEYDEISLFHELGIDVFSAGAYLRPDAPSPGALRPPLPGIPVRSEDVAAYYALGRPGQDNRECLTREFVDRFDAVLVMHLPHWIEMNWNCMRHKTVIWRTIGQSLPHQERAMQAYRADGLRIVRYSPAERRLAGYAGDDAVIRFCKNPQEWGSWSGERPVVICLTQAMPERADACNYAMFQAVTDGLPCELYGPGNEGAGAICRGCLTYDELRAVLRTSRACFYTGTFPASYTLGFVEAWMTGIPVVAIGSGVFTNGHHEADGLYEIPELVQNGVSGFVSDDCVELRSHLSRLLADANFASEISGHGRAAAIRHFGKESVREHWRTFFESLNSG